MFSMSFDNQSLTEIVKLAGFAVLLTPELQSAEQQIGALIIQKTHDNALARFKQNSPGGLAESFVMTNVSPYEIEVGSNLPYARRRDIGFDGSDSLGRVYHDKPYLYFSDAITEVETSGEGMGILQAAVEAALGGL